MSGLRVVALSGGVGGARLLDGLHQLVGDGIGELTALVNTGDDFVHWGLHISPDLDTVMYTLSGLANEARGWGLHDESWSALEMVRRYGGEAWFALGDRDLATHLVRTQALGRGETLSAVTARLNAALGVRARVLPMTDGPCRTMLDLERPGEPQGATFTLSFQDWFVRQRAEPAVRRVWFDGCPQPAPGVLSALESADLILLGPSNPYVSIDPILSLDGVRAALRRRRAVALSPIVGGRAVKGPLAEMIPRLGGRPASAAAIADHYGELLAGLVIERGDEAELESHRERGLPIHATATVMSDRADRRRLARELLRFADSLS
jgi:LPPG:FO 2-phospho-L-lactate transferase